MCVCVCGFRDKEIVLILRRYIPKCLEGKIAWWQLTHFFTKKRYVFGERTRRRKGWREGGWLGGKEEKKEEPRGEQRSDPNMAKF